MATIPTTEEIQEMIFDFIRNSGQHPRPGEIAFNATALSLALQKQGLRNAEIGDAFDGLVADGFFTRDDKLTEKGFARL